MLDALLQLVLFSTKAIIIVILILALLAGILALLSKGKEKTDGMLTIKNLNDKYRDIKTRLLKEMLSKKEFKQYEKAQTQEKKKQTNSNNNSNKRKVFVLNFNGDIKASAVSALREEVSAILGVATTKDEVVIRLESGGGMVHGYGLAAAQLARLRDQKIPLTVTVDKVAASGGYLMASVANKILAAPFAIVGSIGVLVQMPNFNRLLKEKHIEFEQLTAGDFKRTLTMFGHNTEEGRKKLQIEIEEIHYLFKASILQYRSHLDINKVATGEHWLGSQALALQLVDQIKTSDDYLLDLSAEATIYELSYQSKKSLASKLFATAQLWKQQDEYASLLFK